MKLTVNKIDISQLAGNITLNSNTDTLGDQLNFSTAYSAPYLKPEINVGDKVELFENGEVFQGIIVSKTRNETSQDFSCFDYAFYLNKSKVLKQFNKIRADTAIKQLLTEFDVPIGYIAEMPIMITKIIYDKEVSAAIKEILEEVTNATGSQYVMEMNVGKFEIYEDTERLIKATVKLADNLPAVDCMQTISSPTKTASIEEMKNSVKVYIGSDKGIKEYAEAKNEDFVLKYGLLQETQSIEDKDIAQAKNIAENLLKQLERVSISAGVTVLGSFDLRAGRIVEMNEPITNIVGKYKIKSANHSIGSSHTTALDLEVV